MRLRWDWLSRVLTVPYVPTLGPVHPQTLSLDAIHDVIHASRTQRCLPYDKDRRWSRRKDEIVLVKEIIHQPCRTVIPTFSPRGHGTVRTFHYGVAPPDRVALLDLTRALYSIYGARSGRAIWFTPFQPQLSPDNSMGIRVNRILMNVFAEAQRRPVDDPIRDLRSWPAPVRRTFPDFARRLAELGFGYLCDRMAAGRAGGPVLVAVTDRHVVGAIGPLQTLPDRRGVPRLLPQYFGVLPEHRGRGYGRSLWRAAMHWGQARAAYQLLQSEAHQASDRLYLSEGLISLGFACTMPA